MRSGQGVPPGVEAGDSATVGLQLWLPGFPWRPTAGWAVLAALLAYGLLARSFFVDWRTVALALLLADPLWGGIWRLAGGRSALLPLPRQLYTRGLWLPYLQPGSPAARILAGEEEHSPSGAPVSAGGVRLERGVLPLVFRVAMPTILLSLAIGWVLGMQAMWLTTGVIVVAALGWMARQFTTATPAILHSLVTITLPWVLMLSLLNISGNHEMFGFHVGLVLAWTVHHWGQMRIRRWDGEVRFLPGGMRVASDRFGIALLGVADLSLAALLIFAQTPFWLAPLAVLWLPTYLTLYQGKSVDRLAFWWLASMLLSSAAIGSRLA